MQPVSPSMPRFSSLYQFKLSNASEDEQTAFVRNAKDVLINGFLTNLALKRDREKELIPKDEPKHVLTGTYQGDVYSFTANHAISLIGKVLQIAGFEEEADAFLEACQEKKPHEMKVLLTREDLEQGISSYLKSENLTTDSFETITVGHHLISSDELFD